MAMAFCVDTIELSNTDITYKTVLPSKDKLMGDSPVHYVMWIQGGHPLCPLTRKFPDHCVALKNTGHVMNPTQAVVDSSSHKD